MVDALLTIAPIRASPRITGTETGNSTPDPINGILEDGRGRAARGSTKRNNERTFPMELYRGGGLGTRLGCRASCELGD